MGNKEVSIEQENSFHMERNFLADEPSQFARATCYSYVYHQRWMVDGKPDELEIEAELVISDGREVIAFDGSYDDREAHLEAMTRLVNQITAYRDAFARAIDELEGDTKRESFTVA